MPPAARGWPSGATDAGRPWPAPAHSSVGRSRGAHARRPRKRAGAAPRPPAASPAGSGSALPPAPAGVGQPGPRGRPHVPAGLLGRRQRGRPPRRQAREPAARPPRAGARLRPGGAPGGGAVRPGGSWPRRWPCAAALRLTRQLRGRRRVPGQGLGAPPRHAWHPPAPPLLRRSMAATRCLSSCSRRTSSGWGARRSSSTMRRCGD